MGTLGTIQDTDLQQVRQADVVAELEAILNSQTFRTAKAQQKFLRYVVERTLAGESKQIKRLSQNPDVRFIINHSGAAVPTLAGRIKDELRGDPKHVAPNGAFAELTKLYYECAHATYPAPIAATTTFAPTSQLLFGTDFPIWSYETTVNLIPALKLSPELQHALDRGNAERLFPRWKA